MKDFLLVLISTFVLFVISYALGISNSIGYSDTGELSGTIFFGYHFLLSSVPALFVIIFRWKRQYVFSWGAAVAAFTASALFIASIIAAISSLFR